MSTEEIKLGLKENWKQFTILVVVNAFVGGMIGLERTIFPEFAQVEFGVASKTAILSFITAFGITKAIINSWNCDDIHVYESECIPKMNSLYRKLLGRNYHPFNTGTFIPSKIGDSMAVINGSSL